MQAQFGVGLREAAANLRICPTTLKRACRRHGITRWPRRQLAKLNRSEGSKSDGSGDLPNIKVEGSYRSGARLSGQQPAVSSAASPRTSSQLGEHLCMVLLSALCMRWVQRVLEAGCVRIFGKDMKDMASSFPQVLNAEKVLLHAHSVRPRVLGASRMARRLVSCHPWSSPPTYSSNPSTSAAILAAPASWTSSRALAPLGLLAWCSSLMVVPYCIRMTCYGSELAGHAVECRASVLVKRSRSYRQCDLSLAA